MTWQRSARIGAVLVGGGCAWLVYATLGVRQVPAVLPVPTRVDPTAVIEAAGADVQQLRGVMRDYRIESTTQLTYEDGATRFLDATVSVENREGRDFVMTGGEARVDSDESEQVEMLDGVALGASDGFALEAAGAIFSGETGVVVAPGPVSFSRGGLSGTGAGMSYNTDANLLTIDTDTVVTLRDENGERIKFTSRASSFDSVSHALSLDGAVRIERGTEVLSADHVDVELDERGEHATFIRLRDRAEAEMPDGAIETMQADAINLDYSDDGLTIERVGLDGQGEIHLAPSEGATAGRQVRGGSIEVVFDGDGAVRSLGAVGDTSLDLPGQRGGTRLVTADRLLAEGGTEGLESATFVGTVAFRENAESGGRRDAGGERLVVTFGNDGVALAVFTGGATFEDGAFVASGLEAHYSPGLGSLSLRGDVDGTLPRIDNGYLTVESDSIDVVLMPLAVFADGRVQTTLVPESAGPGVSRLPGLLAGGVLVNISADAFEYDEQPGLATYTGAAVLWQGDTTIRGDRLVLDRGRGDLLANGNVQSVFLLDGETSIGRGPRLRYDDVARQVTYASASPEATSSLAVARLSGPQGDLMAGEIQIQLATTGTAVEAIEAFSAVQLVLDARRADGDRLTFDAVTGRYTMRGVPGGPAVLTDTCRRTEGLSLTFVAKGEQVIVDGEQEVRTRTTDTPCPGPALP